MALIAHSSDLHLDGPASAGGPPAVRAVSQRAVVRLVDPVLHASADLLLLAGDVFDRAADSVDAGRFFAAQMGRLTRAGIPVLAAAGNHDVLCPLATGYPSDVRWFGAGGPGSQVFDALGVAVHGQSLADPAEPADLAAGFPPPLPGYANLGLLHTSLDGRASRTRCAPTDPARLAGHGYGYWALGHVHQRWVVCADPWVVYPGSPRPAAPGDPHPPGVTLVTTAAAAVTGVTHHRLTLPSWDRVGLAVSGAGGSAPPRYTPRSPARPRRSGSPAGAGPARSGRR